MLVAASNVSSYLSDKRNRQIKIFQKFSSCSKLDVPPEANRRDHKDAPTTSSQCALPTLHLMMKSQDARRRIFVSNP